jgi:hypothetical protein
MYNKNFINGFLLITIVGLSINLFLNSCQKDQSEVQEVIDLPTMADVVYEDGRLKFSSQAAFDKATALVRDNWQHASGFEKQFKGFQSAKSAYKAYASSSEPDVNNLPEFITLIKFDDGETYARPSVDFQDISYLTNSQGIVQIGNDVLKYTYDNVYKTSASNISILANTKGTISNPSVQVLPLSRQTTKLETEETNAVQERVELASCKMEYDGNRRFYCEIISRIYPGYKRLSVDMDHYRRSVGIWWLNDAPSMNFSGSINGFCDAIVVSGCGIFPVSSLCRPTAGNNNICTRTGGTCARVCVYSVVANGSDESEIFDVLFDEVNATTSHYTIGTPTNVLFTGIGDDNQSRNCSTIQ